MAKVVRPHPFSEIARSRSSDEVAKQIRDVLLAGHVTLGERLPSERELCETLNVSRPTLREAFRSLEAAGIIEIRTGKGGGAYFVAPSEATLGDALATLVNFRGASAGDLAEFRVSFESDNAWWAATRAEPKDIEHLEDLVAAIRTIAARTRRRRREVADLDASWHVAVATATKNRVRIGISLGIRAALLRDVVLSHPGAGRELPIVVSELEEITAAIRRRDAATAQRQMKAHVEHWVAMLRPDPYDPHERGSGGTAEIDALVDGGHRGVASTSDHR